VIYFTSLSTNSDYNKLKKYLILSKQDSLKEFFVFNKIPLQMPKQVVRYGNTSLKVTDEEIN
jgi:putative ribosome biogenesis GTPase RsgA